MKEMFKFYNGSLTSWTIVEAKLYIYELACMTQVKTRNILQTRAIVDSTERNEKFLQLMSFQFCLMQKQQLKYGFKSKVSGLPFAHLLGFAKYQVFHLNFNYKFMFSRKHF